MTAPDHTSRRRLLVRGLGAVALVALVALSWRPLVAWFSGHPSEPHAPASHPPAGASPASPAAALTPLPPVALDSQALERLRAAFHSYEAVRAILARDTLEGVPARSQEISDALRAAAGSLASHPAMTAHLARSADVASRLGAAADLPAARQRFGELSQALIALAAADPRLQEGWHVFACPMQAGFNRWFQRTSERENPYMGPSMLTCGSGAAWTPAVQPEAAPVHAPGEVAHYTCAMHPSVRQDRPGTCPICSMGLTPVTHDELRTGVILIDDARRQRIGVKTAPVVRAPMNLSIRALGRVTYDETALVDITLKLDGYIQKLHVETTGQPVRKGQLLFTLYSPELYAAQQEYLLALQSASQSGQTLARAARKRLELLGLPAAQIAQITARGEPLENVPFLAPASGYILEKDVVEGAAVQAGARLFRIAPLHKVWVQADVYEQDLRHVKVGQRVEVTFPYLPEEKYESEISYIYPALEGMTRTARARIELPNPDLVLKPDMFADVTMRIEGGERLQVPEAAVIYTGPRRLVFVDLGDGRLRPQEVELGIESGDAYEVLGGLSEGDRVVTSGNFLIAAESRIRSAAEYWTGGDDGGKDGGDDAAQ
jgi:Cu(I)/Ag(I) efflux system membrane fusion protein